MREKWVLSLAEISQKDDGTWGMMGVCSWDQGSTERVPLSALMMHEDTMERDGMREPRAAFLDIVFFYCIISGWESKMRHS